MDRRRFVRSIAGGVLAMPLAASAQQATSIPRIGVLWHAGSAEEEGEYFTSVQRGFRDLGYVEGRNIALEHRFAGEVYDRFTSYATELIALKVDVLIAVTRPAAVAAQAATTTIPIVFITVTERWGTAAVGQVGDTRGLRGDIRKAVSRRRARIPDGTGSMAGLPLVDAVSKDRTADVHWHVGMRVARGYG